MSAGYAFRPAFRSYLLRRQCLVEVAKICRKVRTPGFRRRDRLCMLEIDPEAIRQVLPAFQRVPRSHP